MIFDFTILRPRLDGMGVYSLNVFTRLGDLLRGGTLLLTQSFATSSDMAGKAGRLRLVTSALRHRFSPGLLLRLRSRDLYYSPTHHGPVFYSRKILTVHDICPLLMPTKSFKQYIYFQFFLRASIRFCAHVITDAHLTKRTLQRVYGVPARKISVIYAGCDIETVEPKAVAGVEPGTYFLMVGVNSEYKNYRRALEARESLAGPKPPMVVTSNNPAIAARCAASPGVTVKSYLSLNEIAWLYRNAKALIYPSLVEGFGLPALEAARLGIPVLTSKDTTMSEFMGEGNALYVDPYKVEEIRAAMETILGGGYSEEMLRKAKSATADLTWENTADQVRGVIGRIRSELGA